VLTEPVALNSVNGDAEPSDTRLAASVIPATDKAKPAKQQSSKAAKQTINFVFPIYYNPLIIIYSSHVW
jgi:hypothetical protein